MKPLHILILSMFFCFSTYVNAQNVTRAAYEEAVDYINCQLAEVSLKDQSKQPHYEDFKVQVGDLCDYFALYEFLNTRKPQPLEKSLYLCQHINSYKYNYSAGESNRELYYLLSTELFADSMITAFASRHKASFPEAETKIKDYLERNFLTAREVPQEFDDATMPTVDTTITIADEEPIADVELKEEKPEEPKAEIDPALENQKRAERQKLARQLLMYGLGLIAVIALFYFGLKWLEKRQKTLTQNNSMAATFSKSKQINELHEEVASLKNKIAQQNAEINKLSTDITAEEIDENPPSA